MTADHPTFGKIEISFDHTRPGSFAQLRAVQPGNKFPVVHTTMLHVVAILDSDPGAVLQNAGPAMEFISDELMEWPPANNIYRLATNVDFELRHKKGSIVMTSNDGGALVHKVR